MGRKFTNEVGNLYGKLMVLSQAKNGIRGDARWNCVCECGNEVTVPGYCLRRGDTKSCGCIRSNTITGHGGRFVDKSGKRFGNLVVVEIDSINDKGYINWVCQCDCGNVKVVSSGRLTEKGEVKSCGCRKRLPEGVGAFNNVYRRYVRSAEQRGYNWKLTKEQVKDLTKQNCHYCNKPPSNIERARRFNGGYVHNGIDRLDNTQGYYIENVVPCCGNCNTFKMDTSVDEFRETVINIYNHWIKSKF